MTAGFFLATCYKTGGHRPPLQENAPHVSELLGALDMTMPFR